MKQKNLHEVANLIRALLPVHGYIAGGAVRDSLFGVQPKDIDFVVPANEGWDEQDVFSVMKRISEGFAKSGYSSQVYQAYGEENLEYENSGTDFAEMFLGCMKVQLEGLDIDILFSRYQQIAEHVDHHDCNINQVWLDDDGNYCRASNVTGPLKFIRDVGDERKQYMIQKYKNLCAVRGMEPTYDF